MRLVDADALYERLKADEELAWDRVIDTPNSFPNGMLNPAAVRYQAQLSERTRLKEIVYDAPTIEERKWIPCSERLPEEKKEVLISAENELYIAELEIINGREYWSEVIEYRYIENVEAWMPLPEPYAERRTDESND